MEEGAEENLRSFFELQYPDFEIIFSIASQNDPARGLVEKLIAEYPYVQSRLILGDRDIGPNPKINNLVKSYEIAQNDLILISDSNVRVEATYLKRLVAHLDNGVGMLTSVVAGVDPRSLGGHLEAMHLNTFYARAMRLAELFGQPCVVGKSMLFRKSMAKRFGGISALSRYLAEDYMAGIATRRLGYSVVVVSDPVRQQIGEYSLSDYWQRHIRWGRIRKSQAPLPFLLELLFSCPVSAIVGVHGMTQVFGMSLTLALAVHLLIWASADFAIYLRTAGSIRFPAAIAWFMRELTIVPLWIHTALGNTVQWRGQKLVVMHGGVLERVP